MDVRTLSAWKSRLRFPTSFQRPMAEQQSGVLETSNNKLIALFQNRNELKRDYEKTRVERDLLREELDTIRTQRDRLNNELSDLQSVLEDPKRGQNAVFYYQLKAAWETCRQLLKTHLISLVTQYERNERSRFLEAFEREREEHLQQVTLQLSVMQQEYEAACLEENKLCSTLENYDRAWHILKRRKIQSKLENLAELVKPLRERLSALGSEAEKWKQSISPAYPGLSIDARRHINLSLIALTQHLFLKFAANGLDRMIYSAGTSSVTEVVFGELGDYRKFSGDLNQIVSRLKKRKSMGAPIKPRIVFLQKKVTYTGSQSCAPEEHCLDFILPCRSDGSGEIDMSAAPYTVNVVQHNYWGLSGLLLKSPVKPDASIRKIELKGIED